ncbi:MAG: hypothetical protein KatS3mg102_1526 [Planctomycetota bacterium]|nr:MAG: hypothetical protein KatS3mg102_1526 [Planctomycetota bacterium]
MDPHLRDWLDLLLRWAHVIVGIAWIGASFYFNWLENALERTGKRAGIAGDLWAIHGGGFYFVEKYELAPARLPERLHWFKYEAYFTWITGFCLLVVVYYLDAAAKMIDPEIAAIGPWSAIGIGIGTLVVGWLGYDALCRSRLGERPVALALTGFLLAAAVAFALCQLLSGRAAYLHVGALLGTCMAANVFFVIIPNQKALVRAAAEGRRPDPQLGKKALQRSLHNNYLTLPVVFVMISHHFPATYGHPWNWAVLAAIALVGAAVRHWFNLRGRGQYNAWLLPAAVLGLVGLALVTSPRARSAIAGGGSTARLELGEPVPFARVREIVQARCVSCHSAHPTDEVFTFAQGGVRLDTPEQIRARAERIKFRAYDTRTMPFLNKTGMTDEERQTLARWVLQGARLD